MKAKILFFAILFSTMAVGQQQRVDSIAYYILNQTSASIQKMQSISFNADIYSDLWTNSGKITTSQTYKTTIKHPNKIYAYTTGDEGNKKIYFNGNKFKIYSLSKNTYGEIDMPKPVVEMIKTMHNDYGIEFPGADFFFPDFVNNIIESGYSLLYLGISTINGVDCFHIAGSDSLLNSFQIWITDNESYLPAKLVFNYTDDNTETRYEANYNNWKVNPALSDQIFEFAPPPNAMQVKIVVTNKDLKNIKKEIATPVPATPQKNTKKSK